MAPMGVAGVQTSDGLEGCGCCTAGHREPAASAWDIPHLGDTQGMSHSL